MLNPSRSWLALYAHHVQTTLNCVSGSLLPQHSLLHSLPASHGELWPLSAPPLHWELLEGRDRVLNHLSVPSAGT